MTERLPAPGAGLDKAPGAGAGNFLKYFVLAINSLESMVYEVKFWYRPQSWGYGF